MPAVSIVMPAYNVAQYLGDAVRSVLAQTFDDFELLIVDDGSTDATPAIARTHAAADRRVRVLQKPNGGISSARNAAMGVAQGGLIAILDGDDLWEPGYLEAQVGILRDRPEISIVTGNAWFLGGRLDGRLARPCPDRRPEPDLAAMLEDETAVFIMSVFRREVYETIGGFDESLRTNEDYDYWLRAACRGFRFHRNDRPLGRYRRRDDSLSADEARMLRGIVRVLDKTRPALARRPRELAILERRTAEFSQRRRVVEARLALECGNVRAALMHLAALPLGGWRRLMAGWARRLAALPKQALRRMDRAIGRLSTRRTVLVEARTPMNLAVLRPVFERLLDDPRLDVRFTGRSRGDLRDAFSEAGVTARVISRRRAAWKRVDLYINADPWDALTLRRAARQMNFFHGVAGKYDLDCPVALPLGFDRYDRVAFPNEGRLQRYVETGIVTRTQAALVGYPKSDVLAHARLPARECAGSLGLESTRPTAIYAPTFSPASSLGLAGEAIVETLLDCGCNVIVKLHDRSLDPDQKYTGGVDWQQRFSRHSRDPHRFLLAASGDSTKFVQASDLMVTDHSSIGFEFCALDRPVIVYDAPGLAEAARISRDKVALLRSAATVVRNPGELHVAVKEALDAPARLSLERARASAEVFYRPGEATDRALGVIYDLLELPPAAALAFRRPAGAWSGAE